MSGILELLSEDHRRLERLLDLATRARGSVDADLYAQFRAGLLRHISMEEKILLPEVRRLRGGDPLPMEERIRKDHGAIAALLVPPPLPNVLAALRAILAIHDDLEERRLGMYELCDSIVGERAAALTARLRAAPGVPVARTVDNPGVLDATRRALQRAGYNFDDYKG